MDGVDPCAVVTAEQRAALGVERPPTATDIDSPAFPGSPGCTYRVDSEEAGFLVTPVASMGVGDYIATAQGTVTPTEITIGGFPALQFVSTDAVGNTFCQVGVDVADGQLLHGNYGQVGDVGPAISDDVLCQRVNEFMAAAVETLVSQQ